MNEWTRAEIDAVVARVRRSAFSHAGRAWVLQFRPGSVSVFERLDGHLPRRDRAGRERMIACGVALAELRLALRRLGWRVRWTCFPDPAHPDEVARVTLVGRDVTAPPEIRVAANLAGLATRVTVHSAPGAGPTGFAQAELSVDAEPGRSHHPIREVCHAR